MSVVHDAQGAGGTEGRINWKPMVTGKVGFDGVAEDFDSLLGPNDHV